MQRTLIERDEYRYQIEQLGGFERMDAGKYYALVSTVGPPMPSLGWTV